jgi:hypothetical protein
MDSDEMLGAYALAGLSLNMGMANLLAEKGVLTEGEVAGLLNFAKEAIRQAAANASPEVTADAPSAPSTASAAPTRVRAS